ncbi:NAD(P)-dependent dehydrogenase, short-chain alcohol dehydrogenase family [Halogranum rubrum]|uniref:NAD(P)-dependent dehydrogenase, short-chain alcohol dehydrogenase family n=2 Tax=Halogranum rubrum TaxID=553466 RepID=A0A1I4CZG2_9EURY|nr:NAD(P)-dependent dehydrogenase, short-chain alcohol dehydrogenase family [Halogranum rubrum]
MAHVHVLVSVFSTSAPALIFVAVVHTPMSTSFDYDGRVVLVTGASGALGSAIATAFRDAGATVAATDIVAPSDDDAQLDAGEDIHFYEGDFTDESDVERVVDDVVSDHGRLDCLLNVAGTWKGGSPIDETDVETFDLLFDVNLKTMFLASKHCIPHLRATEGAIVSVSARSSLEGGEGDGPYRASKAGVRLLTETIAEENLGTVRANAVMPSVIDTPMNREMMEPKDEWVKPEQIARVMLFLCSDAAEVTSGAAVPVYGEA